MSPPLSVLAFDGPNNSFGGAGMGRFFGLSPAAVLIHAAKKSTARIGGTNRARGGGDEYIGSGKETN